MAEIGELKVSDRVTVAGQEGVFFVLHLDSETLTATLLPNGPGPLLNKIPVETLALFPRQAPNGATTAPPRFSSSKT
jgi:hypothetical protein